MGRDRQLHFAQVQQLIAKSSGCFIKNTGDGVLAAFHNADAVTFARDIVRNTGHAVVRVRAGVHIGQVTIDADDTFGRHVNPGRSRDELPEARRRDHQRPSED